MGTVDSRPSSDRRNRLAYLALHYAISGDDFLSERIRSLIWQIDNATQPAETPQKQTSVTA